MARRGERQRGSRFLAWLPESQTSQSPEAIELRWRRRAYSMALRSIEDYAATVRERVQLEADQLRREATRNPHNGVIAADLVTRLEHAVIRIVPPLPRTQEAPEVTSCGSGGPMPSGMS